LAYIYITALVVHWWYTFDSHFLVDNVANYYYYYYYYYCLFVITFTQRIYNYVPETNHFSRVCSVSVIL